MLSQDTCVCCLKHIQDKHKVINCKHCKRYTHKKCTKLKRKELAQLLNDWVCPNCRPSFTETKMDKTPRHTDVINDNQDFNESITESQIDVSNINFDKYDNMVFNPLRFEATSKRDDHDHEMYKVDKMPNSNYVTPEEFNYHQNGNSDNLSILNVNIRSINKNFEKENLKVINNEFNIIGLSETHLKDAPADYYKLPGYKIEYTNRINRQKGGVCLYISNGVKYIKRHDLCIANENLESCFVEIEQDNSKNILVGVVYRAHTSIDNFITDITPILNKAVNENKVHYLMGDFNIDLLKDDSHRPTHDYLNLVYSCSLVPTIYKPTRITEHSATIIDNILTNNHLEAIKSNILITDISDHFPTTLIANHGKGNSVKSRTNNYY